MRIMTLHEPWASLIVFGVKRHETRRWSSRVRGPMLIHAARTWGKRQRSAWKAIRETVLLRTGRTLPEPSGFGCVVAICALADCRPTRDDASPLFPDPAEPADDLDRLCGDWSPGRYAMRLDSVTPLPEPIPWCGSQGRPRSAPPILVDAVNAQLKGGS